MRKVKEVIVVEGRYDKNTLSQVVDAVILETAGFGIFNDAAKRRLLKTMAEQRGLIVLTDSDGAGFLIRNHIRGCVDPKLVKHAYIPDIYGKERRKAKTSKEGKLGVEGMRPEVSLRPRSQRGDRQRGEATAIVKAAGSARAHERGRYAGCAQRPHGPGGVLPPGGLNVLDQDREKHPDEQQRLPDLIQAHGSHVLPVTIHHAAAPAEQKHKRAAKHKGCELYGRDEYVPGVRAHVEHSLNGFSQLHAITSPPL